MATNHSDGGPPAPGRTELPWHPVLITAAIVISFWLDAAVSPNAAFRSLAVALVGAIAFVVLLSLAFHSAQGGGLVASGLIAVFYSKHAVEAVMDLGPRMGPVVLTLWLIVGALAVGVLVRIGLRLMRRWDARRATATLNRVGVLLLVATVVSGMVAGKFQRGWSDLSQGVELDDAPALAGGSNTDLPDIYVILLDGYPRADVLDFAFEFDNSAFTSALERRGFEVASESHSDYLWTHVTLSSMLSMEYVEDVPELRRIIDGEAPLHPTVREVINTSRALDLASDRGYTTVSVSGGFEQVALRRSDVFIDGGQMNEFELKLLISTFLGDVVASVAPDFASSQHRERITHGLSSLGEVAALDPPVLALAHVPSPHQPTVFGAGGSPVLRPLNADFYSDSAAGSGKPLDQFTSEYRAHLTHLNSLVLDAVDDILANSDVPPVIVLMADHGSASRVDWITTTPQRAGDVLLLERTGTLFAALTPQREDVFPDDISPVDVYRLLYDAYLGTAYGRAEPPEDGGQVAPVDASVLSAQ